MDGLEAPVEVLRDGLGVPHIRARSAHDAFFAQGFVHAQDRLWQMHYDRVRAAGRVAAHLGRHALTYDIFVRRMGLEAAARADHDALDPDARAMLEAYAGGVNAFLDTARALPVEFTLLGVSPEPWRPWDCAAVLKVRHVLMGSMRIKLWRARLLRALGPAATLSYGSPDGREDTLIVPVGARSVWRARADELDPGVLATEVPAGGSNNWAVHGSRTASGLPLLAGDPHRTLEVPNVYYQNRIACPAFDAIGLSMPGVPGIFHFGHNGTAAWCITHAMADTQDLFVERFDARGDHERAGEWHPTERREEVVDVRGAASVRIEVALTGNGPVVAGDPASGTAVSLRWTGSDRPNASLAAIPAMLRAASVDELDAAMRRWVDPCNSVLMADVHGTIGFLHRGRVPVRDPANRWAPVPGWTGEHAWTGDVPFEELPRLRDPDPGFIATANNRVCGDDYPHYLGMDYAAPNRVRRILERLSGMEAATAEDMASIHADAVSLPSRAFVAAVAALDPGAGPAGAARELLLAWDGSMDAGAAAPAVYAALRDELAGVLLERDPLARLAPNPFPEEPAPTPAHTRIRSALPRLLTDAGAPIVGDGSWGAVLAEALERAVEHLSDAQGPDPRAWRWGEVHRTQITHPLSAVFPEAQAVLDPPPRSLGGDADTVLASGAEIGLGIEHASVARYVFDVADWDRSGWVVPLGSSGHPASPHYADQAQRWSDVALFPMTYSWPLVEAAAVTRQVLEPR